MIDTIIDIFHGDATDLAPAMFKGNAYIAWRGIAADHNIWTTFM
jgi:hypothetical protein